MKTKILLLAVLIFSSVNAQKDIDSTEITKKVQADRDWETLEYAMNDLLTDSSKNQPTQRLLNFGVIKYNDDLIKKASQLFETFKNQYPKDERSNSDVQICFNSHVDPCFLPKTPNIAFYGQRQLGHSTSGKSNKR